MNDMPPEDEEKQPTEKERKAIVDWFRLKFNLTVDLAELAGKSGPEIKALLIDRVRKLYTEKEIAFPVKVNMHYFMGRDMYGQQRFDPHGLLAMAKERFPDVLNSLIQDDEFIIAPKDRVERALRRARCCPRWHRSGRSSGRERPCRGSRWR